MAYEGKKYLKGVKIDVLFGKVYPSLNNKTSKIDEKNQTIYRRKNLSFQIKKKIKIRNLRHYETHEIFKRKKCMVYIT